MRLNTNTPQNQQTPPTSYSTATTTPVPIVTTRVSVTKRETPRTLPRSLARGALWACFLTPLVALGTLFQTHKVELPGRATGMKPTAFCSIQGDFNGRFAFTSNEKVIARVSQEQGGGIRTFSYIGYNPKTGAELADQSTRDIGTANLPLTVPSGFYTTMGSQDGKVQATRSEVSGEVWWSCLSRQPGAAF